MRRQANSGPPNACRFHPTSPLVCRGCVRARLEQFRTANFRAALQGARERIGGLEERYRERGAIQVPAEKLAAELRALITRLDEVEDQVSQWRFAGGRLNDVAPPGHGRARS